MHLHAFADAKIYTVQLLRICAPDFSAPDQAEVPAGTWWPGQWRLPKAFKHAVWLVAPPRHLETGQNDLVGEMRKASEGGMQSSGPAGRLTYDASEAKRRDVHRALGKQGESPAWFNVRTGLLGLLIAWVYLVIGFTIEILNAHTDHPSMLNAFGLPNNLRDPRYRPPKVGYHEPTEVGTGGAQHGPAVGIKDHARRLSGDMSLDLLSVPRDELAAKIRSVLPHLADLAQGKRASRAKAPTASMVDMSLLPAAVQPSKSALQWPALMQPKILCGHPTASKMLALSHHGRGSIIPISNGRASEMSDFALHGAHGQGPLIAGHWDEQGLLLVASTGALFSCPDGPAQGIWRCHQSKLAHLPIQDDAHFRGTVAISRLPAHSNKAAFAIRAAVAFPGESAVAMFAHSGEVSDSWLPSGEVRTRAIAASLAFASSGAELLLASKDGAVARLHLSTGERVPAAAPIHADSGCHAVCAHAGGIARLARSQPEAPALFLG